MYLNDWLLAGATPEQKKPPKLLKQGGGGKGDAKKNLWMGFVTTQFLNVIAG